MVALSGLQGVVNRSREVVFVRALPWPPPAQGSQRSRKPFARGRRAYVDRVEPNADRVVRKDQRAERWTCGGEGLKCLPILPAVECIVGILQAEADEGAFGAFRCFFALFSSRTGVATAP